MRQFVNQDQRRLARQGNVDVELLQHRSVMRDFLARDTFEAGDQRFRFLSAMGFDHADDNVRTLLGLLLRCTQHPVGLADTGRGAKEDLELAASRPGFLFLDAGEKFVRIGALVGHWDECSASSARLSLSTLTRGSPKTPHCRSSVCASMMAVR